MIRMSLNLHSTFCDKIMPLLGSRKYHRDSKMSSKIHHDSKMFRRLALIQQFRMLVSRFLNKLFKNKLIEICRLKAILSIMAAVLNVH